jgi:hypothetical protein
VNEAIDTAGLLTRAEVADLIGVTTTAGVAHHDRVLRPVRVGRQMMYRRETVEQWLVRRREEHTQPEVQRTARCVEREERDLPARKLASKHHGAHGDDAPGDRLFAPPRVDELARVLTAGELLYTPPCSLDEDDRAWYDARRGAAPRFAELQERLARRGLQLVYEDSFYWTVQPWR